MPFVSDSYQSVKLELRRVNHREVGVFARRAIRKGELLIVSGGRVLPYHRVKALPRSFQRFCFHLEHGFYLVPPRGRKIALGYWVNHSCAPNAGDGRGWYALSLMALRRIRKGEEVTCDYRTVIGHGDPRYRPIVRFRCRCGSRRCAGLIRI